MKITFFSSGLAPEFGGSAESESALCRNLAEDNQVDVLCLQERHNPHFAKEKGIHRVIELTLRDAFFSDLMDSHWLGRLIHESDVVHLNGHWSITQYFIAKLCCRHGIPYIIHPRGMYFVGHRKVWQKQIYNQFFGDFIARNSSCVIALSEFESRHFAEYPISSDQIQVIPNGITLPYLKRNLTSQEKPYFLYLGRIEQRKNLLFLLEAFSSFTNTHPEFELRLRGPVETKYDLEVKNKIDELDLKEKVHLLPPLYNEAKWDEIQLAQAVLYPTVEEAFGRVPFEAVASLTYPLVPKQSGSWEYLAPFFPDTAFELGNVSSLVSALEKVSGKQKHSPELEKAFQWVKTQLDWKEIKAKVLRLYSQHVQKPLKKVA